MNVDDVNFRLWRKRIGTLPKGFFIKVSNSQLSLYYKGPGYERLTEPGGSKPTEDCAYICMHSIRDQEAEKVCKFIREEVARTQKALSS